MPTWRGRGLGHGLRRTARTKKGGGVDRQRNGDAGKEGNTLRHTRNCNSFARGVNALCESAPARIERTRRSDDAALPWPVPFRNKGGFRFC